MAKGDKCYTKKNKNGGNYTTCVDSKGKQLRENDIKPKKKMLKIKIKKEPTEAAPKKKMIKIKIKKEPTEAAPKKKMIKIKIKKESLENVSATTAALSASAPKAAPPAANYNMLRPEIRKHIIGFIRDEEFSPSTMNKAQIDSMYEIMRDDEEFRQVEDERFSANMEYGGEYREGYFFDKDGATIESRYDRAETKFRKDTKRDLVKFLKRGGRTGRKTSYDKKTIKELRDVYVEDF